MVVFKSLLYLCATPLAFAFTGCDSHSALNEAVEQAADATRFSPPGQFPIGVRPRPHHHPKEAEANGTIYETLANDPRFSKITKALNFVDDIGTLLNDTSAKLTFFATPDEVLRRPKHSHRGNKSDWSSLEALSSDMYVDLLRVIEFADLGRAIDLLDDVNRETFDDPDSEKRKKWLRLILHAILSYHIIPSDGYDIGKLGLNTTYPTNVVIPGTFDGQPLRLRIEQKVIPPVITVNFFSRVIHGNISATNGFIHAVSRPILPPPSIFQELYAVPQAFSIFTSTLQRSNLTTALDLRFVRGEGFKGAPLVTVFAPTNRAFEKLPRKLQLFLFSPFGERILAKLLQYHIVPETSIFSDYLHDRKVDGDPEIIDFDELDTSATLAESKLPWFKRFIWGSLERKTKRPNVEIISRQNLTLETALFNHTLNTFIIKKKITFPFPGHRKPSVIDTKVFVNHQLVHIRDIVGLNGAIHVIDHLLDPRKPKGPPPKHGHHGPHRHRKHKHHDSDDDEENSWDDWEEWLPQWAQTA